MTTKVSFVFQSANSGWTETWYLPFDPATQEFSLLPPIRAFAAIRAQGLAKGCSIVACRLADPNKPNVAYNFPFVYHGTGYGEAQPNLNLVNDCINARGFSAPSGRVRPLSFRAVPDGWIAANADGTQDVSGNPVKWLREMVNIINLRGFQSRFQTLPPNGGLVRRAITAITRDADTGNLVLTVPGHGYTSGMIVNINRVGPTDLNRLNGQKKVTVIDANKIMVGLKENRTLASGYNLRGTVFPVVYFYEILQDTFVNVKFSTRDTGRPLGGRRGRRSARR